MKPATPSQPSNLTLSGFGAHLRPGLTRQDRLELLCRETASQLGASGCSVLEVKDLRFTTSARWHGENLDGSKGICNIEANHDLVQELKTAPPDIVVVETRAHPTLFTMPEERPAPTSVALAPMVDAHGVAGILLTEFNENARPPQSTLRECLLAAAQLCHYVLTAEDNAEMRQLADARNRLALEELIFAEDRERRRIVNALQNQPLRQLAELAKHLRGAADTPARFGIDLSPLARECEEVVRSLDLMLDEVGPTSKYHGRLARALRLLVTRNALDAGWNQVVRDCLTAEPPAIAHGVLVGLASEAIENTALHAQASTVVIVLRTTAAGTSMSISDDGSGFDPLRTDRPDGGLALARERALGIGGRCHIDSQPGAGTRLEAWVPN